MPDHSVLQKRDLVSTASDDGGEIPSSSNKYLVPVIHPSASGPLLYPVGSCDSSGARLALRIDAFKSLLVPDKAPFVAPVS